MTLEEVVDTLRDWRRKRCARVLSSQQISPLVHHANTLIYYFSKCARHIWFLICDIYYFHFFSSLYKILLATYFILKGHRSLRQSHLRFSSIFKMEYRMKEHQSLLMIWFSDDYASFQNALSMPLFRRYFIFQEASQSADGRWAIVI